MRIPIEAAATLVAVIDAGSLDAAAQRLRVTPSAVSQRIKALEDQLGQVLLVRTKPVRATPAAYPVVRFAREVLLLERDALAEMGQDAGAQTVALAVNADSLATWFLAPLARVSARHPVTFDLHRDDQDFTAGLLESGTVMGAVTSRETPVAGCDVTPLGTLRYEAVATPAFVARWCPEGVAAQALAAAPLVDFDRKDDLQSRWLADWATGLEPPRHRVPASHDFATAVMLGLGWALLPRLQSQAALEDGRLVLLGGPVIEVPLFWQQWRVSSPTLALIAAEIIGEGRRVLAR